MRIDPSDIYFGLRTNQWMSLIGVVGGIVLIIMQNRRHPGIELSPYRAGFSAPVKEPAEQPFEDQDLDSEYSGEYVADASADADAIESINLKK